MNGSPVPAPRTFPAGPSGFRALRYLGWKRDLLRFTARLEKDFGRVCGVRLFGLNACLISDPELIGEVFAAHFARTKKWEMDQFELILGKGLLTSQGALWKRQRALIQPAFAPARLEGYVPAIVRHAREMLSTWPAQGQLDVHESLMRVSLRIAAEALFGADTSAVQEPIAEATALLARHFEDSLRGIPLPLSVPTPKNLAAKRAIRRLDAAVMSLVARRREQFKADAVPDGAIPADAARPAGASQDLLGALLAAQDDAGQGMSDQQLRDECMTMILAGHETTATVLTWTLWHLARRPELQPKAAQSSEYLRNVIHESMRLCPPVWAIGRTTTEAFDLGPYHFPKNTHLVLVPYLSHRDPAVFKDALEFSPERWDDPSIRGIPRGSYLPFGLGPRKCVGQGFAFQELMLILGEILKDYRFTLQPGHEVEFQAAVTLRPRNGMPLQLTRTRATS